VAEPAQLLKRDGEFLSRLGQDGPRVGRIGPEAGIDESEGHGDRDEPLLGAVVEVALEAAACVVRGGHDPGA
jgi:hypothetical protein